MNREVDRGPSERQMGDMGDGIGGMRMTGGQGEQWVAGGHERNKQRKKGIWFHSKKGDKIA